MPDPPTNPVGQGAKGIGASIKRVPRVVWLVAAGGGLGLVYAKKRAAKNQAVADATVTPAAADPGALSYSPSPVGAAVAAPPDSTGAAETVGAVGQTALETSLTSLTTIINTLLSREYGPNYQQPSFPNNPSPAVAPPPPQPAPPSSSGPVRPAGYLAKNTINTGTGTKTFPGASGVKELARDNKAGIIAFGVAYPNHVLQRWHYDNAGAHRGAWRKVSESRW